MLLEIKVIARVKNERVEKFSDGSLKVWINAAPEKGKANKKVILAWPSIWAFRSQDCK